MGYNYYPSKFVREMGISSTMSDIVELMGTGVSDVKSYCTSKICTNSKSPNAKVEKRALRNATECPDCGHALIWVRTYKEKKNGIQGKRKPKTIRARTKD